MHSMLLESDGPVLSEREAALGVLSNLLTISKSDSQVASKVIDLAVQQSINIELPLNGAILLNSHSVATNSAAVITIGSGASLQLSSSTFSQPSPSFITEVLFSSALFEPQESPFQATSTLTISAYQNGQYLSDNSAAGTGEAIISLPVDSTNTVALAQLERVARGDLSQESVKCARFDSTSNALSYSECSLVGVSTEGTVNCRCPVLGTYLAVLDP